MTKFDVIFLSVLTTAVIAFYINEWKKIDKEMDEMRAREEKIFQESWPKPGPQIDWSREIARSFNERTD